MFRTPKESHLKDRGSVVMINNKLMIKVRKGGKESQMMFYFLGSRSYDKNTFIVTSIMGRPNKET